MIGMRIGNKPVDTGSIAIVVDMSISTKDTKWHKDIRLSDLIAGLRATTRVAPTKQCNGLGGSWILKDLVVVFLEFIHEFQEVVELVALFTAPAAAVVEVVPVEIEEVGRIEQV